MKGYIELMEAKKPAFGVFSFLGPSDLAFSLGVPLGDPAVETAIETVLAASKEAGVPLGTLCGAGEVEMRLAQGFQFLAVGGDAGPSASVKEAVGIGRKFKWQK